MCNYIIVNEMPNLNPLETLMNVWRNISSIFSRNSEVNTSEFLETLKKCHKQIPVWTLPHKLPVFKRFKRKNRCVPAIYFVLYTYNSFNIKSSAFMEKQTRLYL